MKIAIINYKCSEKNTGAENFSISLLNQLNNKSRLFAGTDKELNNSRINKIFVSKNKIMRKLLFDYYNPKSYKSIIKQLRLNTPDLVHINNFYGIGSNTINKISKKYPVIMTIHDYFPICYSATLFKENTKNKDPCICYFPLGMFHKRIMHNHLKQINLVSPSEFLAEKLISSGFKKVKVIPNGINLPKQTTNYKKNILFVGRLSPEKGLQTIIKILNEVKDYQVLVLGEGPLRKELEEKYKNIRFLGFQKPDKYYKNASIALIPSIWSENFSYSVLEGMSYGLCVLGSNIGGIPEQITHKRTGLLFKSGDEQDFKEKLDYLLKNSQEIKRIGINARNFVKKKFNWKKVIKQYEEVYKQVIKDFKEKHENPDN